MKTKIQIFHTEIIDHLSQDALDLGNDLGMKDDHFVSLDEQRKGKINSFSAKLILGQILRDHYSINRGLNQLSYADSGKPFLEDSHLKFNFSHSGNQFAVAIAEYHELGMDIQLIKSVNEGVVKKVTTADEQKAFYSHKSEDAQKELFFEYWTKKEAAVKQLGEGIKYGLSSFSTVNDQVKLKEKVLTLQKIELHPSYKAAVAFERNVNGQEIEIIKL